MRAAQLGDRVLTLPQFIFEPGDRIRIGTTMMAYLSEDHADADTALIAAAKKSEWKRSTLLRD